MNKVPLPKVAVIGCGHWGKNIIRNFAALGALGAVSDYNQSQAASFAETYKVPALSWDAVLADPAIQAVVLVTPIPTHVEMAHAALNAGKDVYVEKPLALRAADATALFDKAAAKGRLVMVGHLLMYHPAFLKLAELVKAGEIGRVRYIAAHRLNYWIVREDEDVVADLAPHDLSMVLHLMGELPHTVTTAKHHYLHPAAADIAKVSLQFTDAAAHLYLSRLNPYKEQRLSVLGETGTLVFDDTKAWDEKLMLSRPTGDTVHQMIALGTHEPLQLECQHFLECIQTRVQPRTSGQPVIDVTTVLEKILEPSV